MTVYSIDDQAAANAMFYRGVCDAVAANNVPYSYIPMLNGAKRGGRAYKDFKNVPYDGSYFYQINTEKYSNRHLRRALAMSIDRSAFPELLHGGEQPSSSFVPGVPISSLSDEDLATCGVTRDTPGLARVVRAGELCYLPPVGLEFNVENAKRELDIARKEMGAKFPKEFDVKYNIGVEGHKIVAEYIQQEWSKNLGMKVSLSTMEWKTYLEETTQGNYEIARFGWIGGAPNPEGEFHLVFKCGSPYNRARWCNKDYDRLFKEAEATVDMKRRMELLAEAEKVLVEDAPIVPLYVYTQKLLKRPYVEDLFINMGANPPMHRVRINPDWKKDQQARR